MPTVWITTAKYRILAGSALALMIVVNVVALGRDEEAPAGLYCERTSWECSAEAQWLRRVLAEGGLRDAPSTGSALVITREGPQGLFFWAVRPGPTPVRSGFTYPKLVLVDETQVYSDGVRATWLAQNRHVYLEPVPELKMLEKLVRLTHAVRASD
jgi:hypothetical protein